MAFLIYMCFVIVAVFPMTFALITDKEQRSETSYNDAAIWRRHKRDLECGPGSYDFQCSDGTCLSADKKCDGTVDCPDGTDEKYHICRTMRCPYHHFRCTYGACVDGTASCNGVSECADDSDELQPACRNEDNIMGDKFKCDNGELIEVYQRCDGTPECSDSTDERLATCANVICPSHLFQCAYGACVDSGADCNNLQECADGSDESDLLCNRTSLTTTTSTTTETSPSGCVLPNHPKYGLYRMTDGVKYVKYIPGSVHETLVVLNATCYPGFKLVGDDLLYCHEGIWSSEFPQCARTCKLEKSQSVEYRCILGDERFEGTRECGEYEVEGTTVQPECRKPNYYSPTDLYYMLCLNGEWNYKPRCEPECGTLTPHAQPLVLGGRVAEWGEVPWHAGVYSKRTTPPTQICGASLLSVTVLVSAAHCFWFSETTEPAEDYAVAVGKLYREWGHPFDLNYKQTSDVKTIYVSRYYRGNILNYQHDIAILLVAQPFSYRPYIRPLCINFPQNFNDMQLKNGDIGKVAGWGLTTVFTGSESPNLKVLDLPYVDFDECLRKTPGYYQDYFSGDKICGGFTNGTSLCKGDSGGGFAFAMDFHGRTRYFLRGIVSTSPPLPGGFSCNIYTFTTFTEVLQHKNFIMMHLH